MTRFEESIHVDAPVELVYRHWSDFERFPQLLSDVRAVRRIDDRRLAWRGVIAGEEHEIEVTVTENTPNRRIAWASHGTPRIAGAVMFAAAGDGTEVTLIRESEVEGLWDSIQSTLAERPEDVRSDLRRFKQHIETEAIEASGSAEQRDDATRSMARTLSATQPQAGAPGGYSVAAPNPAPPSGGGRGSASAPPGAAGVDQRGGGTGGMGAMGGGGGSFDAPRSGTVPASAGPTPPAGGVAVNPGRGSDLGVTGGTLGDDRQSLSGGSFGGSNESDVGPGLTDGMRSGHGADASGAMGTTGDGSPGLPQGQRPPAAEPQAPGSDQHQTPAQEGGAEHRRVTVGDDDATGVSPDKVREAPGSGTTAKDNNLKRG